MAAVAVADMLARTLPLRPGDTTWRIGTVGIISLSVPTLLLALLVALLTAAHLEHRVLLRVLAGLSLAAALVMAAMLPLFGLDLLELRRLVAAEGRPSFDHAMGRAALTITGAAVATGWMAYAGWRAGRKRPAADVAGGAGAAKKESAKERAVVVGRGR